MTGLASPQDVAEFRERLAQLGDLPKRLRQCADHLGDNLDRIAVSTVAELAAGAGVPPSAMMRFCHVMGFGGFSDMQRLFRNAHAGGLPDYATRLRILKEGGADQPAALVAEFVESGRQSLENLAKTMDEAALAQAVRLLSGAEVLHLVGLRRSFPVAAYLAYVFENLAVPAVLHGGSGGLSAGAALRPNDAVLAISFAPYASETLDLVTIAKARGLRVVALSDSAHSPFARAADVVLTVSEVDFGAFRALSATLALALGLAVSVASARDVAGAIQVKQNRI